MAGIEPRLPGARLAVPDGVLVVDKPEGPTSHDVVARARRALGVRQVGHTGTLDPMATGALALVIGRATRLAQFLSAREKTYQARVRLGVTTDTWDRTGTPLGASVADSSLPDAAAIERTLERFLGEHAQLPPPYSAKKVAGVRAYELARKGKAVAVEAVRVTLHSARIDALEAPLVELTVTCSAGFYVRALAHELGRQLGCGACLDALRRTASGSLSVDDGVTLEALERRPEEAVARILPIDRALPDLPFAVLNEAGIRRALHGNEVGPAELAEPLDTRGLTEVRLLDADRRLLAIARPAGRPGVLHPAVVLK